MTSPSPHFRAFPPAIGAEQLSNSRVAPVRASAPALLDHLLGSDLDAEEGRQGEAPTATGRFSSVRGALVPGDAHVAMEAPRV